MVDDVKGRDRRAKREFMIGGMRIATAMSTVSVSGFVVAVEPESWMRQIGRHKWVGYRWQERTSTSIVSSRIVLALCLAN
jgi:hypothetical protein